MAVTTEAPSPVTAAEPVPAEPVQAEQARPLPRRFRRLIGEAGVDVRLIGLAALVLVLTALIAGGAKATVIVAVLVVGVAVGIAIPLRMPAIGFVVMLLASPLLLTDVGGGIKVSQLLAAAGCFAVVVALIVRGVKVVLPATVVAAAVFVALIGLGVIASPHPAASANAYLNYLLGLAVAICVTLAVVADRSALRWILRAWIVGALLAIVPQLGETPAVTVRFGGALVDGRTAGIFAQPNDYGEFALYAVFVSIALLLFSRVIWDRLLAITGLVISLYAVVESLSRGSWIGLAIGLVVLGVFVPRIGLRLLAIAAATIALVAAAAAAGLPFAVGIMSRAGSVFDGAANPEDHRDQIWAQAQTMWFASPWTGVGLGRFRDVTRSAGSSIAPEGAYHAHNAVLQFGAEGGVLAVIGMIVLVVTLIASALHLVLSRRQRADRAKVAVAITLFAALAAIAGHGLVDFVYTNPMLLMMAWVLFGLAAGAMAMPPIAPEPEPALESKLPAQSQPAGMAVRS